MDNSQSSDVFSDSGDYNHEDRKDMDTITYEELVANTKLLLTKDIKFEVQKSTFSDLFSAVLEDCRACVDQSLELVTCLLTESEVNPHQLCEYLDNAVNIVQMLCCLLTNVIESATMACCSMKSFPSLTGKIILTVFTHCKDSDSIYRMHLKAVEQQLKDLFKNCHQLQLTYLLVLEKHYIFDFTDYDNLGILLEALDINLKIGELVQTLDVKTMAEQWKAFTMICEKYSDYLVDGHIFEDCIEVLCKMTKNNIKTALEHEQEDKISLRSLKVASFTIKILLRMCNIFKNATRDYECIMDTLLYIYLNSAPSLETEKSTHFMNLVKINVSGPAEALLKELLMTKDFVDFLHKYPLKTITKDDQLLGYILFIVSAVKSVIQVNINVLEATKLQIINCIFQWLPYGHVWFNVGLKFKCSSSDITCGLYEHLLSYTNALVTTFDSDQMTQLEQILYKSLLGTDCYSALFSSNLWELIARSCPRQLLYSQVISLCKVYQKLENNKMFPDSPQHTHLSHTLRRLFQILHPEDKMRVNKLVKNSDGSNTGLWAVLGIQHLDIDPNLVVGKLERQLQQLFSQGIRNTADMDDLIKLMHVIATASPDERVAFEDDVVKAWLMLCPRSNKFPLANGSLDRNAVWCLKYVQALSSLTGSGLDVYRKGTSLMKILHVVSSMIEEGNTEVKLVLINLLQEKQQEHCFIENRHLDEEILVNTFKFLIQDTDELVKNKFLAGLWRNRNDAYLKRILQKVLDNNITLQEWNNLTRSENNIACKKEKLSVSKDLIFTHKCVENVPVIELSDPLSAVEKTSSNNFDLADIDTLFEVGSDSEPACKKAKLESAHEQIVTRLENDVTLLCNLNRNEFTSDCKVRIRILCEKLVNMID